MRVGGEVEVSLTRSMEQLTWVEVREAVDRGSGVILPIGSTEQHGFHLPLATDSILATDLALAVADSVDMLVAPTLRYGYRSRPSTGGGQTFVGTTSLRGRTLMSLVEDVLSEFLRHGFRRIVILNWHLENQNFIYESAYEVIGRRVSKDAKIMVMESAFDKFTEDTMNYLFPEGFPGWGIEHASIFETSLMLYLHPELVQFEEAVDDQAERYPWYDVVPPQSAYIAKSGTLWKATQASRSKGERAWSELVPQVRTAILDEFYV